MVVEERARRAPAEFAAYALGLTMLVIGIVTALLTADPAAVTGHIPGLIVWGVLLVGVDLLPVPAWSSVQLLMDFPLLIALTMVYDPPAAAVMVVFIASIDPRELKRQIGPVRALFNRSQLAASALAAGAVYHGVVAAVPGLGVLGAAGGAILPDTS